MSSASDLKWKYLGDAGRGLVYGLCLGLLITFVIGVLGAVMGHYCLVPVPPGWCPW